MVEVKASTFKLAEAERSYCSQLAKMNNVLMDGVLVDMAQATDLIRAVSEEEIKEALFNIGDDRAPPPEGFSAHFFKRAWRIVGTDFCDAIREFFSSGDLKNHGCQTCFGPSRYDRSCPGCLCPGEGMVENIYLVQDLLNRYGWSRISPRCIMKIDLRKAYDTINWGFMKEVLTGLGFPSLFVGWLCSALQPLRILFLCQGLNITHLAFADDLFLFSRGDVPSVQLLLNKLESFGDCSEVRVSIQKSNLFAAGIPRDDIEIIKNISSFSEGRFPFRYLGLPVATTKLTIAQFHPFTDRIAGYINFWAGMNLSYAGRCEMIRSILQGVECFWLSSLPIPAGIRERPIRMCRNFLWGDLLVPVFLQSACRIFYCCFCCYWFHLLSVVAVISKAGIEFAEAGLVLIS
ncbi:hypothetical protein Acr_05g0016810 [Actinidia rufa]|uniref:Reverse transcriptase domain-containing protein n=1 Tax=Actinidia rufa TaxID=165716 RepID=A0A7J0ENZ9_9ERIC|nr:hypothetical protein Acr_05g0016810 [Actinidia rufa]